jgi:rare lipoprotein A
MSGLPRDPGRTRRLRALALAALAVTLALASSGCRRRAPAPRPPQPTAPIVQGETGIASWYGHPYHGRRSASGEIYDMNQMTAAHRTLPFGTRVRVHNLENGENVTVRINDRGPFVKGRIIDLSYRAAQTIRMPGIARVRLEILDVGSGAPGRASPPGPGVYAVQVGAFADRRNAENLRDAISPHFRPVQIQTYDRGDTVFFRVRVGRESSEAAAENLARRLIQTGFATETFVVRLD